MGLGCFGGGLGWFGGSFQVLVIWFLMRFEVIKKVRNEFKVIWHVRWYYVGFGYFGVVCEFSSV